MNGRTTRGLRYAKAEPDPIYRTIGANIRRHRKARGWTVEKLAAAAGVQRGYFTLWEAGTRRMFAHQLVAIARALEVDLSALVPEDTEPVAYTLTATRDELLALRAVAASSEPR